MSDKTAIHVGGSDLTPSLKSQDHLGVLLLPNEVHSLLYLLKNLMHQ